MIIGDKVCKAHCPFRWGLGGILAQEFLKFYEGPLWLLVVASGAHCLFSNEVAVM